MKTILSLLLGLALPAFAEGFSEKFEKIKDSGDHKSIAKFLEDAAENESENPDFYALAGNHWWQIANSPSITTKPADGDDLSVRDQKTGEEVGSISIAGKINPELRAKAIALLSEGSRKFPERADLVLGLASILTKTGDDAGAVAALLGLLETSKKSPLKWTGNAGLPSKVETFLPEAIQGYSADLYRNESEESDVLCAKLCDATISRFPDHPYAYNIKAALASAQGKPEESLKLLATAAEKAPDDPLVLLNLGDAYRNAGNIAKAKETYGKILSPEGADDSAKAEAKQAMEALNDK